MSAGITAALTGQSSDEFMGPVSVSPTRLQGTSLEKRNSLSAEHTATIMGLLRTAATELSDCAFTALAFSHAHPHQRSAARVPQLETTRALLTAARLRGSVWAVPRLVPSSRIHSDPPWVTIVPAPRSSLANLAPEPVDLNAALAVLAECEVLVNVKAVGLNFRHVAMF